jgi:hypothetical protein
MTAQWVMGGGSKGGGAALTSSSSFMTIGVIPNGAKWNEESPYLKTKIFKANIGGIWFWEGGMVRKLVNV